MSKTLIIFPLSFPYSSGQENSFLQNEITELCSAFDKIIIIPSQINDEKQILDSKVIIETSFAEHNNAKRYVKVFNCFRKLITSKLFFQELLIDPRVIFNYKRLKIFVHHLLDANHKFLWIDDYLEAKIDKDAILYSYWFTSTTTALCMCKAAQNRYKVITRAHGIDLFKIQNDYYPFRTYALKKIDRVILVSLAAKNYLAGQYAKFSNKFDLHRLGVFDHHFTNPINDVPEFNIVSCSSLIPVKRVDLLTKGILNFSKKNPDVVINWHHFGDGFLIDMVKSLIASANKNLRTTLHGHVNNDQVLEFYKKQPVNVFITTSLSEGGCPVSIQEAYSFGIPAIATAVGGIPEIVNNNNGILLSEDPSVDDVGGALNSFYHDPNSILIKRKASKDTYQNSFNSDKNFKEFVISLNEL